MQGVTYKLISGQIVGSFDVPFEAANSQTNDVTEGIMIGVGSGDTDYVNTQAGAIEARIAPVAAFASDRAWLFNDDTDNASIAVPEPCFITINNELQSEVTVSPFVFKNTTAGKYIIQLVGKYKADPIFIDVRADLTDIVAKKRLEVKKSYSATLYGGFTYDGNIYDSDEISMNLISGSAAIANRDLLPATFSWKTSDNILIAFNKAMMLGLEVAMFTHVATKFAAKEAALATLNALITITEVENFDATIT